jgi:hypothetical protein
MKKIFLIVLLSLTAYISQAQLVLRINKFLVDSAVDGVSKLWLDTSYNPTGQGHWKDVSGGSGGGGGSSSLTSTYVGYGSGANALTGDANFTYTGSTLLLNVTNPSSGNTTDSKVFSLKGKGNNSGTINTATWNQYIDMTTVGGLSYYKFTKQFNLGSVEEMMTLGYDYSLGFFGSTASAAYAIGFHGSTASGVGAIALSQNATVAAGNAAQIGGQNTVIEAGALGAVSAATDAHIYPLADYSFVGGDANDVWGESSFIGGFGHESYSRYGFSAGHDNLVGYNSTDGLGTPNLYTGSFALGGQNIVLGDYSGAIGRANTISGDYNITLGRGMTTTEASSFNVGFNSSVPSFKVSVASGGATAGITTVAGALKINTITAIGNDDALDSVLVLASDGTVKYRTAASIGGGGGITELTGDVTASGSGSVVATIAPGVIVNADINASAAIAYSKLNLTGAILNADLAGAVSVAKGGTAVTSISAKSIWVANSANTITEVTPGAGQSIRINAGNTAWEAYTPGSGGGDVTKVGTPVDNQVGVWTGNGTIEGVPTLTFDGNTLGLNRTATAGDVYVPLLSANTSSSSVVVDFYETTGLNFPRVTFQTTGGENAGFRNIHNGTSQFFFGMANDGQYGGTVGASSGRYMGYYDLVANEWRYGFNADGDLFVGSSNASFSARIGPSGNYLNTANVYTAGNILMGGTTTATSATKTFHLYNGTVPSASITDGVLLYSEDVAASAELKTRDEAGNVTVLSPHNFSGIPQGKSEEMAWAFYSERDGKYINVDMLKLARIVENITGEKLVYIGESNKK